jgi:hypothetical protein
MKVSLVGAELEENLGLRYMASSLESSGHRVEIIPFNPVGLNSPKLASAFGMMLA